MSGPCPWLSGLRRDKGAEPYNQCRDRPCAMIGQVPVQPDQSCLQVWSCPELSGVARSLTLLVKKTSCVYTCEYIYMCVCPQTLRCFFYIHTYI